MACTRWIPGATGQATPADLGTLAARLHQVSVPDWLPALDPLVNTRRRIAALPGLAVATGAEVRLLEGTLAAAEEVWGEISGHDAARVVVHGDLTAGNVLTTRSQAHILLDWENSGVGAGVWDAAKLAGGIIRFGRGAGGWHEFATAYRHRGGPARITGGGDLLSVYDLIGTVWTVYGRALDPDRYTAESHVRLATLTDPDQAPRWRPL